MHVGDRRNFLSADKVEYAEENELKYSVQLLICIAGTSSMPDHQQTLMPSSVVSLLQKSYPATGHVKEAC